MQNSILFLSNSNLFTIASRFFLPNVSASYINLRYSNEELSKTNHFVQQLKEIKIQHLFSKGIIRSPYDYFCSDTLIYRIERALLHKKPSFIVYEMKSSREHEWNLLEYLVSTHSQPVIVFYEGLKKYDTIHKQLKETGVSFVISSWSKKAFQDIFTYAEAK